MVVAAHVFDGEPPPPELSRALNYQAWGVVDIMTLPAGMLRKMNTALSYYRAFTGYKQAVAQHKTVEYTRNNPDAWDMVSKVLAMRKGIK